MSVNWYVATVQRGKEAAIQVGLRLHGVEVFNPEIVAVRRGRTQWEPLFPNYLFCSLDLESGLWPRIRWARGLRYFLGAEHTPTPVPDSLMEEIKARVERWNDGGWESAFKSGDRVRIGDGALSSLEAIFTRYLPGRQRCEVLVSLVGRLHTVQMHTTAVEALRPMAIPA
jgi:transcriptional antiterminator NusG